MGNLHSEWASFIAENPNISHDDEQRNPAFYLTAYGRHLVEGVSTYDTTIIARDSHKVPIRIYNAKDTKTSAGLVIFFHSGGFSHGSLETEDVSCRYMALETATTVVSVDYRLSPEHVYPVPINDGWDAFMEVISRARDFVPGLEARLRLIICGTSSGGQIAAIVSQRARSWIAEYNANDRGYEVIYQGVLLRAPVTVRATDREYIPDKFQHLHHSWSEGSETLKLDRANMENNHDVFGVPLNERTSPDAYPLWGNVQNLPKTFVQICEVDILRDDAVCYVQGLEDAGVQVKWTIYKGLPHIFWVYVQHLDVSKNAQRDCVDGLKWLLDDQG